MTRAGLFFRAMAAVLAMVALLGAPSLAASVRVTVNDEPISDIQISQRAKLMELERRGNSGSERSRLATEELIDEALQLAEAKRLGISISSQQVNEAYLNVARNLKLSVDKLNQVLTSSGVNPETVKDRLRATMAWGQVTQTEVQGRVQISDLELEQRAAAKATESRSFDYVLKEVRFIIPQGSKVSPSRRTAEANQYRKNFSGCDNAVELSLAYTDAAVLDIGRRHGTQLPEALADELAKLGVGGITKPRVVDGGVSMLAVCSKDVARDLTFLKSELRQETGTELLQKEADAFLAKLRSEARIVYPR